MQVIEMRGGSALCLYRGETTLIDTKLVGEQTSGTWLLVLLGTAHEVISAENAQQVQNTLESMRIAMQGESDIDHLFEGRTDHKPEELPEFL